MAAARRATRRHRACCPAQVEQLYDAFEHPRAERVALPLLAPAEARAFLADVRGRVFDELERLDASRAAGELFPYVMVEQHEQQHVETMLATHQLRDGVPLLGAGAPLPPGRAVPHDSVLVPAGEFVLGVDARRRAVVARQRAAGARRRPAGVPHRPGPGHQRASGSSSSTPAATTSRGGGRRAAGRTGSRPGCERPLFWSADGSRRRFGIVEDIPRRRARPARLLLRGRGLRGLGRRPAAHRAGVGEGLRVGSGGRACGAAGRGARPSPRRRWPTSAARRCGRRRSARTRAARRPTASSS